MSLKMTFSEHGDFFFLILTFFMVAMIFYWAGFLSAPEKVKAVAVATECSK